MHSSYDDKFDAMKDKPAYQLDDWESIAKEAQRQVAEMLPWVTVAKQLGACPCGGDCGKCMNRLHCLWVWAGNDCASNKPECLHNVLLLQREQK